MYPITTAGLALFKDFEKHICEITLYPTNTPTPVNITEADIKEGGFSLNRASVSGNNIEIGSVIASELTLRLDNSEGTFDTVTFEGGEMYIRVGTQDWDDPLAVPYYVPLGYFTVDNCPAKYQTISITAFDRMAKFQRDYDSTLSYPATVEQILTDACTRCGVTLATTASTLLNYDYSVATKPTGDNLTYRDILRYIAEITCTCAYIDWEGKLRLEWYASTTTELKTIDRFTSNLSENSIAITGVSVTDSAGTVYLTGNSAYSISIENNLLIQGDYQDFADDIYAIVNGFTYTPYSCQAVPLPHVYPLDMITYTNDDGSITTIVTNAVFKLNGRTTVEGKGETTTNKGYAALNPLTGKERMIIEKAKQEMRAELTSMQTALLNLNELISNSLGMYKTEVVNNDGSVTYYMHDNATLESSMTIYTVNAGGFAWTKTGWNGGSPTWQYGFSADGNAVFRNVTLYGISVSDPTNDHSTEITPAGFEISYRNNAIQTLQGSKTILSEVGIATHLEISNARIVPTTNGIAFIYVE